MERPSTVTAILAIEIVRHAARHGVSAPALLADAGITLADLASRHGRISLRATVALFDAAARRTGDDSFGLHLAEVAATRTIHAGILLIQSSPTLRHGYERAARYVHIINDTVELRIESEGPAARLVHHQRDSKHFSRHGVESFLATAQRRGRLALGPRFHLTHVTFRHAEPAQTSEHTRIFGAPVTFGEDEDALHFSTSLLDEPLPAADERVLRSLEHLLEEIAADLPRFRGLAGRTRRALTAALANGATLEDVAARLALAPRTLQRQLRAEGTTYHALLDSLRRELAFDYLGRPALALAEVALLLGFSEQSAFQRAFRRWTGVSPAKWRREAS